MENNLICTECDREYYTASPGRLTDNTCEDPDCPGPVIPQESSE